MLAQVMKDFNDALQPLVDAGLLEAANLQKDRWMDESTRWVNGGSIAKSLYHIHLVYCYSPLRPHTGAWEEQGGGRMDTSTAGVGDEWGGK